MKHFDRTYTKADLLRQLGELDIPRDRVVLVHTSLRLIGNVEGGAQTLLDALIEHFAGNDGLLCIPTHTWKNIGKPITLDLNDPTTCLGAFPTFAAADPRGIRSENPTHSMVVFGNRERALRFIENELNIASVTAPDSCYGKLYDEAGYVLLVGVSHHKNTYLHAVDEIVNMPNRLSKQTLDFTVKRKSGELVNCRMKLMDTDYTPDISWRFHQYETAFRYHGAITNGYLGDAPVQACSATAMKETVELILKNNQGKDPLETERPIPPAIYSSVLESK